MLEVKGGQAVLALAKDVETAGAKIKTAQGSASTLTDRFAQATSTTGKFAQALDATTTTLARSASAFGLPTEAIRGVNDVSEIAALGFNSMSSSATGLAAALGPVAFAVAAVAGAVRLLKPAFDEAVASGAALPNEVQAVVSMAKEAAKIDAAVAATRKQIADRFSSIDTVKQITNLRTLGEQYMKAGLTGSEALERLRESHEKIPPVIEAWLRGTDKQSQAAKKAAEENERAAAAVSAAWVSGMEKARAASDAFYTRLKEGTDDAARGVQDSLNSRSRDRAEGNSAAWMSGIASDEVAGPPADLIVVGKSFGDAFETGFADAVESLPGVIVGAIQGGGDVARAIGATMGGSIGESLGQKLGEKIGGTLGKALGAAIPVVGTLIGDLAGKLLGKLGGLFGGGEHGKVNDMRDQFIAAAGGITELDKRAQAAGLTVDRLLAANKVSEFEAAVRQLNDAFDMQAASQQALNDAVQKYGFSIEELGPKFRQQELDKMAGGLLQDYKLLTASGIENVTVIEKMAPAMNEYVQTALASGAAIPEAMRPQIDKMIEMGLLTDANGKAFTSAEEAGITYTQSMTEQFTTLIEKIDAMVNALLGIPSNVGTTVTVTERHVREDDGGRDGDPSTPFARGGIVPPRMGGTRAIIGEGGQAELVAPVKAFAAEVARAAAAGSGGGGGGQVIQVNVDGHPIFRLIQQAMRDGKLRVHPAAVTAAGF